MKRIILLSILMALASFSVITKAQDEPKAQINFNNIVHDYGTIEYESNGICDFEFTNSGIIPLVITNVKATCGCTAPSYTKDPVEPGKTGKITVKYNTKLVGNFTKTINVESNAANSPVILTIKGIVNNKVQEQSVQ
jgi:hypothetical protein